MFLELTRYSSPLLTTELKGEPVEWGGLVLASPHEGLLCVTDRNVLESTSPEQNIASRWIKLEEQAVEGPTGFRFPNRGQVCPCCIICRDQDGISISNERLLKISFT